MHSVLLEFADRGEKMGYYQGMNFICLYFMLLFGAEENISVYALIKLFSLKSKIYNICFDYNNKFIEDKEKEYWNKILPLINNIEFQIL